jgi:hypothetical protein
VIKSEMKDECKRLCNIKSLRQLRCAQRENEAAKMAAAERVKSASLKVVSVSEFVLLLVKRYAPTKVKRFVETIFGFTE